MKKSEFLQDVKHEIDMLKKHATEKELARLDTFNFDPENTGSCIYGQMTGDCQTIRAKVLMDKSCIRVMKITENGKGSDNLMNKVFSQIKALVNGKNTGQGWNDKGGNYQSKFFGINSSRDWSYLSVLEAYICLKGAKNKSIIQYLKGEIKELTL